MTKTDLIHHLRAGHHKEGRTLQSILPFYVYMKNFRKEELEAEHARVHAEGWVDPTTQYSYYTTSLPRQGDVYI